MRTGLIGAASLCLLGAVSLRAAPPPPPPLPAEHLTVEQLPPHNPHWVYVFDEAFFNEIDARVHLFDGDTYRRLGPDRRGLQPGLQPLARRQRPRVVATTYFARGGHGARTDVVEFTDNTTLATHAAKSCCRPSAP